MTDRRHGLSKSRILSHVQCPKRLWLQVFKPDVGAAQGGSRWRMASGQRAGEVARGLFPGGHLVDEADTAAALNITRTLLAAETRMPIYEAALEYDGVLVYADILLPEDGGWHLVEVKSSTSIKDYQKPDATVQAWVAQRAGVHITRTSIACIDTKFVYPGDGNYQGLFYFTDITALATELGAQVGAWVDACRATLAGGEPAIVVGDQCFTPFDCPFYGYCAPPAEQLPEHPLSDLPNARKLVAALTEQGYEDLRQVPAELLTNGTHLRIHQAAISGEPYLSETVHQVVGAWAYPRFYLDFETIQFTVPIWAGTKPYQQIPFQWSCHVETAPGVLEHREFLAEGDADPRRGFAGALVALLASFDYRSGSIIAYNAGFERSRISELAREFPEFAGVLNAAIARVVDLLPVARQHFYHPEMHGSWSIKYVLPAIAPELSYKGMAVADGMMAQEAFGELLAGQLPPDQHEQKRQALRDYCEQDTYAMVKIAHFFEGR